MTESGNLLDNAEVDFLLDGAMSGEPSENNEDSGATEQTVTMRGDLDQINLSDIFQTLALTKMEGVLRVHNPLEQRQVYCFDGYVRIIVPPRIIQRRIGQRLVQSGLITPDQLRSALMRQRKDRTPLGQLLINEGAITEEQIDEVAGIQVAEDLFSLFTWCHGTFEFYKGPVSDDDLQARFETCPEFEVSSLLLEVARRSDEWESILAAIGNLDELPVPTAEESPRELNEIEYTIYRGADGQTTYRQLAEQTTQGLFKVARVARDMVNEGLLANIGDEEMVAAAEALAENSHTKQAVMVLQTLRDRPTDLSLDVVRGVAAVLDQAGERKLAGITLLEVAQLQTDPELCLSMGRDAVNFAPHDPATLSFLRGTLLVHAVPDSPELEQVTMALIDALLAEESVEAALEIIDDARKTGSVSPTILQREARARQKNRDTEGAVRVYEEVAEIYREAGELDKMRDAYEAILRIDRSRKDVHKLVHKMRQSKSAKIIRLAAAAIAIGLLGSMGMVLWQQQRFEDAVRTAGAEIAELVRTSDRIGARERLNHWAQVLGQCEEVDDLRRQVDFADASELQRQTRLARRHMREQLVDAAELLERGELRAALDIYARLRENQDLRADVDEVIATRLDAMLTDIEETAKTMRTRLPGEPTMMLDRRELSIRMADIKSLCRPALYTVVDDIATLHDNGEMPQFLSDTRKEQIVGALDRVRDIFARSRRLSELYTAALKRSETQRRFDPLFKEALRREEAYDFTGALELFRQLQQAEVTDPQLKALFRDHVNRNATICKLMEALANATGKGDYAAAKQQQKALELAFPDVPFERLVRLPLRIESQPPGADVNVNGAEVGKTPCTIAFVPADANRVTVDMPGFRSQENLISSETRGSMHVALVFEPQRTLEHGNAVDAPPTRGKNGEMFLVDRGGNVTALPTNAAPPLWTYRTGDLSGLLSQVFLHEDFAVFASIDGDLRALDAETGALAWTLPDMPTESPPVQFGPFLALATTTDRILSVDLTDQTHTSASLATGGRARLLRQENRLIVVTQTAVTAFRMPSLKELWQQPIAGLTEMHADGNDEVVVVVDDNGQTICLDGATGEERWRQIEDGQLLGPPILDGSDVLLTSSKRFVRLALADGSGRRVLKTGATEWTGRPALVGRRLLAPAAGGKIQVMDVASGQLLYCVEGSPRGARILPWANGALIALPDRRLHFYPTLR